MTVETVNFDHKINSITASFRNLAEEKLFKLETHGERVHQLRAALIPLAGINFFWIYVDYLALALTIQYMWLTVGRFLIIGAVAAIILSTRRRHNPLSVDTGALIFLLVQTLVGCGGMILKQESAAVYVMVGVFLVLYIYIVIPNRFLWTVASGILASGIFVASIFIASDPTHREFISAIMIIVICNGGGAATARRAHLLQRMRFASSVDEKTARKTLEIEVSAKDQAVRAKNYFIAAASHDLRQPTQSLLLFSALLQQNDLGEDSNKLVDGVVQSTEALQKLLNSLLDISRLDSGLIAPDSQTFKLSKVIQRLVTEVSPLAKEKDLQLRAVLPETITVNTDPTLLERSLRNFLVNAVQYTEKGRILIGCRRSGNMVRIEVWDTGQGVPEEMQEKVFDDFFQVNNPGRENVKGLGLGLSTVKRMADILGLTVSMRSIEGRGSMFSIEVPVSHTMPDANTKATPVTPMIKAGGLSILLIDDDVNILKSFKELAEVWGCQVTTAVSEVEAERTLEQTDVQPDLIIADYRLNDGQTGIQAILKLREWLGYDVQATILTGDTAPELLKEISSAGLGILHKPLGADELQKFLVGVQSSEAVQTMALRTRTSSSC